MKEIGSAPAMTRKEILRAIKLAKLAAAMLAVWIFVLGGYGAYGYFVQKRETMLIVMIGVPLMLGFGIFGSFVLTRRYKKTLDELPSGDGDFASPQS